MSSSLKILLSLFLLLINAICLSAQPQVLITYYSKTGNTKSLAEAIATGVSNVEGVTVVIKRIDQTTIDDLLQADAIIVGSPVYNANVAPEVQAFIASWPFEDAPLKDKIGAAFVTAGGISAGEEVTLLNILQSMLIFGMIIVGGDDWTAPFGASAVRGESPFEGTEPLDEMFLLKGVKLGQRVANLLMRMK